MTASSMGGAGLALAGLGFVGAGIWGRREVRAGLERERIVGVAGHETVASGAAARELAETIRSTTLESTGGRTYAEVDEDAERTLWLQSTTLQTALMQAYMGARVAELTIGVGVALVGAGATVAAAGSRR